MTNDRFIDNENGTITDEQLHVMWRKVDSFQDTKKWLNWFKGQDYIEITNMERFAGSEDWRYPTEEEAWSLFNLNYKNTDKYGDEIYLHSIRRNHLDHRRARLLCLGYSVRRWNESMAIKVCSSQYGLSYGQIHRVVSVQLFKLRSLRVNHLNFLIV
jgi:hypothetical protein